MEAYKYLILWRIDGIYFKNSHKQQVSYFQILKKNCMKWSGLHYEQI